MVLQAPCVAALQNNATFRLHYYMAGWRRELDDAPLQASFKSQHHYSQVECCCFFFLCCHSATKNRRQCAWVMTVSANQITEFYHATSHILKTNSVVISPFFCLQESDMPLCVPIFRSSLSLHTFLHHFYDAAIQLTVCQRCCRIIVSATG